MVKCKDCEFWCKSENDPSKGICKHPERNDSKNSHYYYGFIKADDYCVKGSKKIGENK